MWFYQLLATVNSTLFDFQNNKNNNLLLLLFNLRCKQSFILKLRVSYEEVSSRMGVFKAEPFTRPRPCLQYSQYDMNEMAFKNLNDKEVKVRPVLSSTWQADVSLCSCKHTLRELNKATCEPVELLFSVSE